VRVDLGPLLSLRARHGFDLIDLQEPYAARAGDPLFLDPVHPSALGNAVAADAVRPILARRLGLAGAEPSD
jgi:hypothetical protein